MKAALFILGILISFNAFSENEEWRISTSEKTCSIKTSNSVNISDDKSVHYLLAFTVANKSRELPKPLKDAGVIPNKVNIAMYLSLHHRIETLVTKNANMFDLPDTEIKEPIKIQMHNQLLSSYSDEYGVTHYLTGKYVTKILDEIANKDVFQFYISSESSGNRIPISVTNKRFMLHYQLLRSCAEHFV
jgi:hypothetical protein